MPLAPDVLESIITAVPIRALGGKIWIIPDSADDKTAGGILLPDKAQEIPRRGMVVAVGPGRILDTGQRIPPDVSVGDVVVYGKYAGSEVRIAGQTYMIVDEDSLYGIMKD